MARVTVEDCVGTIPNRFELVLLAAQRAREIAGGATITVARDNDKNAIVALREISEGSINLTVLRQNLANNFKKFTFATLQEADIAEIEDALIDHSHYEDMAQAANEDDVVDDSTDDSVDDSEDI